LSITKISGEITVYGWALVMVISLPVWFTWSIKCRHFALNSDAFIVCISILQAACSDTITIVISMVTFKQKAMISRIKSGTSPKDDKVVKSRIFRMP